MPQQNWNQQLRAAGKIDLSSRAIGNELEEIRRKCTCREDEGQLLAEGGMGWVEDIQVYVLRQAIVVAMEEVEKEGFSSGDVEWALVRVLQRSKGYGAVQKGSVMGVAKAVESMVMSELLCCLEKDDGLPKYYAEQVQSQDEVRTIKVDKECVGETEEEEPIEKLKLAAKDKEEEIIEEEECYQQEQEEEVGMKKQEGWEQSKAWILENAYGSSSEDDFTSEDDGDATMCSDTKNEEIEDWEIWGDPREVERRKAERARKVLTREDRIQIIASDMAKAKENASAAKARGDKNAQKEAGSIIGQLRREMQELELTDDDLMAVTQTERVKVDEFNLEEKGTVGDSEDDDLPMDFDLFESAGDQEDEAEKPKPMAKSVAKLSILSNENLKNAVLGRKKKEKGPSAKSKEALKKHPKALLQQLVQREGFGAPKFEKIMHGEKGSYRFQVLIDVPKSKSKRLAKFRAGIHRYVLDPSMDGWPTIQEAQDGCATRALFEMFGGSKNIAWEELIPPFDDVLLKIADLHPEEKFEEENRSKGREDFAKRLVDQLFQDRRKEKDEGEEAASFSNVDEAKEKMVRTIENKKRQWFNDKTKAMSDELQSKQRLWCASESGEAWRKIRALLPVAEIQQQLLDALDKNDIVIVRGETGSGKTTQIPQFVLDGAIQSGQGGECNIVCTQPRRIAAISVAERVSEERGEKGPGKEGSLVGYSVRFDNCVSSSTRLVFATTGILLRRFSSDPALVSVSHIIVDEVHERSMQSDFLITMLRDLVHFRKQNGLPLKVVLMSATLNSEMISSYFEGCPILNASGRTFPVQHLFLEDIYELSGYVLDPDSVGALRDNTSWKERQRHLANSSGSKNKGVIKSQWGDAAADIVLNPYYDDALYHSYSSTTRQNLARVNEDRIDMDLLEDVVMLIHETQENGAILVFVPGMAEIENLRRRLEAQRSLKGHIIVPLHSSISPKDQKKAFKIHPTGIRKIVVATNIAETSVTIEDIVFVVDTGRLKERRYDPSRSMSMLVEDTISVANATQRKGRAGRVREGICYSLYTRHCFEMRMKKYQTPEIMRVPLEEIVLQIHHLHLSEKAEDFLANVLQPPAKKSVIGAVQTLISVGALTNEEQLTPLGHHLARLPVDARIGKILILGCILQCISPALSIAAYLSHKSPFISSQDQELSKSLLAPFLARGQASEQQSDHLVLAAVMDGWIHARSSGDLAASSFAKKYSLSVQNVRLIMEMRSQFAEMLSEAGLLENPQMQMKSRIDGIDWYDHRNCLQNANKDHPAVVKSVLVAALYPNVAVMDDITPGNKPTWHDGSGDVTIHPSSVLSGLSASNFHRPFLVYNEKMRTSKVFLRECSTASPLSIFLFGGDAEIDYRGGYAIIDGWIRIKVLGRTAAILLMLRDRLSNVLRKKIDNRKSGQIIDFDVIESVKRLLDKEEQLIQWNK